MFQFLSKKYDIFPHLFSGFGISALALVSSFNVHATEAILGITYDSCTRFSNGQINFCTRNGEKWFLFKEDFIKYTNLKNNRWRVCINASPLRAQLSASLSSSIDVEINCPTQTIESLRTVFYEGRFCEGPSKNIINFKRGEVVNPIMSKTDPFGFLEYLSCNKKFKTIRVNQSKKPPKKDSKKREETSAVLSDWYENPPKYCNRLKGLEKACEDGNGQACYEVALAYEPHEFSFTEYTDKEWEKVLAGKHGVGKRVRNVVSQCPNITPDMKKMKEFLSKSCEKEFGDGCYKAGETNYGKTALKYYENGCFALSSESCFKSGMFYLKGDFVRQDFDVAKSFFEIGCDNSVAEACYQLGRLHEEGHGSWVFQKSKAKTLYEKACDLGNSDGCKNYKRLNR